MKTFSTRFRAVMLPLTLALAVLAATLSPAPAAAADLMCDVGCIAWDIWHGCTSWQTCCVDTSTLNWSCWESL